jgi:hypothetical protein
LPNPASFDENTGPEGSVYDDILNHTFLLLSSSWGALDLPYLASWPAFVEWLPGGKVGAMKTPNQLSREAVEEFKAIYQEEFGEALSDGEVQEIAMRLLRFFGILEKQPLR